MIFDVASTGNFRHRKGTESLRLIESETVIPTVPSVLEQVHQSQVADHCSLHESMAACYEWHHDNSSVSDR
jgi:hypothetical protein